jgi:hypothetical protein
MTRAKLLSFHALGYNHPPLTGRGGIFPVG